MEEVQLITRKVNMRGLTIYDPRLQDRTFKIDEAKFWSSKEHNVLFFETEDYDSYSNTTYVGKLLKVLILESKVPKVGIRISNFKSDLSRISLERSCLSNYVLTGILNSGSVNQVVELFNEDADYQTWDFYGLESDFDDLEVLKPFPESLKYTHLFPFALEIDLDGMLLGYISPMRDLNSLTTALQHSAT